MGELELFRSHSSLIKCAHTNARYEWGKYYKKDGKLWQMRWKRCLSCKRRWPCDERVEKGPRPYSKTASYLDKRRK